MADEPRLFRIGQPNERPFSLGYLAILLGLAIMLYLGVRLAHDVPQVIQGPKINLTPASLPLYASLSVGRMLAAYFLSILFSVVYGHTAAYNHRAEKILIPLLDVLQSVPFNHHPKGTARSKHDIPLQQLAAFQSVRTPVRGNQFNLEKCDELGRRLAACHVEICRSPAFGARRAAYRPGIGRV